jgi:aminomethyltransferase
VAPCDIFLGIWGNGQNLGLDKFRLLTILIFITLIMREKNKTPLYNKHLELNATMVNFAGYEMPMRYKSIFEETKAVRNSAGLFDVSHMGEIEISGNNRVEFINYLVTSDITKLKKFEAKYTIMLDRNGGIIDDVVVYNLPEKYFIVVNAANQETDFKWIQKHRKSNIEIQNTGKEYFQLAVQGPNSQKIIAKIVKEDPSDLNFYHSKEEIIGKARILLSRTGYTGEDGFEIYGKSEEAEEVWDKIMKAGKREGVLPCGLGARDLLRLEMGYCLYGNDITKETTPLEANLSWVVSLDKKDFIGKEVLLRQEKEGTTRKLVGILVPGKKIPRHGYKILVNKKEAGIITSGNYSPNLDCSIAMGYISNPFEKEGTEVEIQVRDELINGKITKLPFWKNGTVRKSTSLDEAANRI